MSLIASSAGVCSASRWMCGKEAISRFQRVLLPLHMEEGKVRQLGNTLNCVY